MMRDQSATGVTLSAEQEQNVAEQTAWAIERMKAEKLAAAMPCADQMIDGFNLVADMTPEMEQAMNEMILREEMK